MSKGAARPLGHYSRLVHFERSAPLAKSIVIAPYALHAFPRFNFRRDLRKQSRSRSMKRPLSQHNRGRKKKKRQMGGEGKEELSLLIGSGGGWKLRWRSRDPKQIGDPVIKKRRDLKI